MLCKLGSDTPDRKLQEEGTVKDIWAAGLGFLVGFRLELKKQRWVSVSL
jgi:hypothetical protein